MFPGLFSDDHMEYEIRRERLTPYQPSLTEMVQKAIQLLLPHENGFFLAVEGGKIDLAHHTLNAKISLHEVYSLDNAVATALQMLPLDDTLVVGAPRENARVVERLPEGFFAVTADHSHTLSITGYPERGKWTAMWHFSSTRTSGKMPGFSCLHWPEWAVRPSLDSVPKSVEIRFGTDPKWVGARNDTFPQISCESRINCPSETRSYQGILKILSMSCNFISKNPRERFRRHFGESFILLPGGWKNVIRCEISLGIRKKLGALN